MNHDAESLRDVLSLLMPYAVEIRYPDDEFLPSPEDAHEAREAAGNILQWLKTALPDLFKASMPVDKLCEDMSVPVEGQNP